MSGWPAVGSEAQRAEHVVFEAYSPLASGREIVRRMHGPTQAAEAEARAAAAGQELGARLIDLNTERFALYVPPVRPPNGYGVLVFVPPWPDARVPEDWRPILDREGVIMVSADRSGNEASVPGRRVPLALLAAHNVSLRYLVDQSRVFVAGFSGGSRVALRLAVAYPDVFRGAVLDAGSDPVGGADFPLPPKTLLQQLQAQSRLVLVVGAADVDRGDIDAETVLSLKRSCIAQVERFTVPGLEHEIMPGTAFLRALKFVTSPVQVDDAKLSACRTRADRKAKPETPPGRGKLLAD